jgi:hypothetical protein
MTDDLQAIARCTHPRAAEAAAWVKALGDEQDSARDEAFSALTSALNDGALLDAAGAPIARALITTASRKALPDRARLVALLADLTELGPSGDFVTVGLMPPAPVPAAREAAARTTRDAVKAGFPAYVALLEDGDPMVRTAAPMLLSMLPELASRGAGELRNHLGDEADPWATGSALLALGVLDRHAGSDGDRGAFEATVSQTDGHVLVQFGAAAALALTAKAPLSDRVVGELLSAVEGSNQRLPRLVWNDGDLRGLAARLLTAAAARTEDGARLDSLLELSRKVGILARTLVDVVVALFPGARQRPAPLPRVPSDLAAGQRFALRHLIQASAFAWDPFQRVDWEPIERVLQQAGLPTRDRDLRRWIGLSAPGALDEDVGGEPAWHMLRRALDGRVAATEVARAVGTALGASRIVEMCAEAARGDYDLDVRWPAGHLSPEEESEDERKLVDVLTTVLAQATQRSDVVAWAEQLLSQPDTARSQVACVAVLRALEAGGGVDSRFEALRSGHGNA